MVNGGSRKPKPADASERRERSRDGAAHALVMGGSNLNPFGDLHTLQHLSARFARSLRGVFEQLMRQECRTWAEPLVVQRFADYRAERPEGLTAWLALGMGTQGNALAVFDGRFVIELLDLYFGGTGAAPQPLPAEFSPAAEAMVGRLGQLIAEPLKAAWEPLARIDYRPGAVEANPAMIAGLEADAAVVVTRFGIAAGNGAPAFIDLAYPVSALKPHTPSLTGKVVGREAEPDPAWRNGLTRAVMGVKFPVRSVLAEPVIPLAKLLDLKVGDVIPIGLGSDVPVMVGSDRLGTGTVGTSNGHAAIKLTSLLALEEVSQ